MSNFRNCLGGSSLGCGLIFFASSETYVKTFGKLGYVGPFVYVAISLSIIYLIWGFERTPVPEEWQVAVEYILSVSICIISVELDKLVPGKPDALSAISYGSLALASVSTSRKSEFGFETGFFAFFQSPFLESLFKINWELLPIILIFGLVAVLLRHHDFDSSSSNGDRPQDIPLDAAPSTAQNHDECLDLEATGNQQQNNSISDNVEEEAEEALSSSSSLTCQTQVLEESESLLSTGNGRQNNSLSDKEKEENIDRFWGSVGWIGDDENFDRLERERIAWWGY